MIRTTMAYVFVASYIFILSPFALAWSLLTKRPTIFYTLGRFCIRVAGLIAGVRVKISGREKLVRGETYLFVPNHQGNCDAPVMAHAIPGDFSGLIKKELMSLPVLSLVLKQAQFVPVDRRDPAKAHASVDRGAALLKQGRPFISFPEGTRSRDGRLGEFKKGLFVMAIKAQKPVVPITILNSRKIQPPGTYRINPGTVEVIFHDPIPTRQMTLEDRDRLMYATRQAIASALE
jgi:1-acyl-sn-glycerol-3-phosphate acyltransferase